MHTLTFIKINYLQHCMRQQRHLEIVELNQNINNEQETVRKLSKS